MTRMTSAGLVTAALFSSTLALADVKAGVDSWTKGDYAAAVREWATLAAKGDPDAQFNMAQAYRLGRGVDTDLVQAEALYAKAAAQGHVKAADNYGLLLFQRGARAEAMPYVSAAASRGDPRAQYLMGIAHFNGDLAEKDWQRAYALLTLANAAGLPQARGALTQMDQYIPIEDRQAAQTLAAALKTEADAERARELAAVDLALASDAPARPVVTAPPPLPPVAAKARAGADFTLPAPTATSTPPSNAKPGPVVVAGPVPAQDAGKVAAVQASKPALPAVPLENKKVAASGPWKIQLGAFGVPGNAEKLWSQLSGRSELAGRERVLVKSGKLTVLYAGGFASEAAAGDACASLKKSGRDCLVKR